MKSLEVGIKKKPYQIYIATEEGWELGEGHIFTVEQIEFGMAIQGSEVILVESSSGILMAPPLPHTGFESQTDVIAFIGTTLAPGVSVMITTEGIDVFKTKIEEKKKEVFEKIGEKPQAFEVDLSRYDEEGPGDLLH